MGLRRWGQWALGRTKEVRPRLPAVRGRPRPVLRMRWAVIAVELQRSGRGRLADGRVLQRGRPQCHGRLCHRLQHHRGTAMGWQDFLTASAALRCRNTSRQMSESEEIRGDWTSSGAGSQSPKRQPAERQREQTPPAYDDVCLKMSLKDAIRGKGNGMQTCN